MTTLPVALAAARTFVVTSGTGTIAAMAAFGLVALTSPPAAVAAEVPQIFATAAFFTSKGALHVNGVPIRQADSGPDGTYSVSENISMWLRNGENTLAVSVEPLKDGGKATVKVLEMTGKVLLDLEQTARAKRVARLRCSACPNGGG